MSLNVESPTKPRGHTLDRETFTTSRLSEFCSQKELTSQTGHSTEQWPLVILKELLDNALDAGEEAGIAPEIKISVSAIADAASITIADNGPGMPPETVKGLLDFNVRVSSREAYVSPTRGAQGNALKTVVAMPFALDGSIGETIIEARGVRHLIRFAKDGIRQEPKIAYAQEPSLVRNGTLVAVKWPNSASDLEEAKEQFLQIAEDYTWINPHLSLDVDWTAAEEDPNESHFESVEPGWRKWLPSDPTSAHWYDTDRLERLAGAYVAKDQDRQEMRTVRDFISEFRGMSGSAKQKAVMDVTDMSRKPLSDLFPDSNADRNAFDNLLSELQSVTNPVRAKDLGIIGEDNILASYLDIAQDDTEHETIKKSFKYKRILIDDDIPAVIEVAFAYHGDDSSRRRIITGVNWSVGINNPFRQIRYRSLDDILQELRVGADEPVNIVIHLAYPRATYTDRGKSALTVPASVSEAIVKALTHVTADCTRQRQREERSENARWNRLDKLTKSSRVYVNQAAYEIMEQAYEKVRGPRKLSANARQIMYAARPYILERTGKEALDDAYFTQTLLPNYQEEHGLDWDVVYDDRGHFREPHTDYTIGLGTLSVRNYLASIHGIQFEQPGFKPAEIITRGPQGCYRAVMFVEKEGFDPLWRDLRLAERFDVAIKSTKGMSVTAARRLADELAGRFGIPLFVLHDMDKAGFSILGTLSRDGRRYKFKNKVKVIDLGFRLGDVSGLQREKHSDQGSQENRAKNLRLNGATEEEIEILMTERVELNAMTSEQLAAFVEGKFRLHGLTEKIVPDNDTLANTYKLFAASREAEKIVERELKLMAEAFVTVPSDLDKLVREVLQQHPEIRWDEAVQEILKRN
jgi:DNA topoisomerase VI subunit B